MSKIKPIFLTFGLNSGFLGVSNFGINSKKRSIGVVRRINIRMLRRIFGIITAEMSANHIIQQINSGVK